MNLTSTLVALSIGVLSPISVACNSTPVAVTVAEKGDRPDLEHQNLGKGGLAISGYDPVSYFEVGGSKPRKGKSELSVRERGVTYRFATKENMELFKKSPAKFEPYYGGWCAYAMADGSKVEIDPTSYLIQDGHLLLFYKSFFNNTRKTWSKKPADYAVKADRRWAEVIKTD